MINSGAARGGRTGGLSALAVIAALSLAGCGGSDADKGPAQPAVDAKVVMDPTAGTGPWFICDALNAPTVVQAGRPNAAGEVTIMTLDKTGKNPPFAKVYALSAPESSAGNVVRKLTLDGAEAGHVTILDPASLPNPAAATTPPVVEVGLNGDTLACRWLPHTRVFGLSTARTAVITDEKDGSVFRIFEFKDTGAPPLAKETRTSTPTIEIHGGMDVGENDRFTSGNSSYSVGPEGITTMEYGRVTSGEPFIAAQTSQPPS